MTTNKPKTPLFGLNRSASKSRIIFSSAIIILLFGIFIYYFIIRGEDTGDNRIEKDYITKHYVVEQIMERQITNGGRVKYSYDFIEPEGEEFNLSLPIKFKDTNNYSQYLTAGDTIEVKVYKPELEDMQSRNILNIFGRFMKQDNREVEVFKLIVNNKELFNKNITNSDVNFRKGSDLSVFPIFIILFALVAVATVIGNIRNKINAKKK